MHCEVLDDLGADTSEMVEFVGDCNLTPSIPSSHQVRHDSNFMNSPTGWTEAKRSKALALRHLWVSSCPVIGTPQIWCLVDEPCWLSIVTWARWNICGPNLTKHFMCFPWFILDFRWYMVVLSDCTQWTESLEPDFMSKVLQDRNWTSWHTSTSGENVLQFGVCWVSKLLSFFLSCLTQTVYFQNKRPTDRSSFIATSLFLAVDPSENLHHLGNILVCWETRHEVRWMWCMRFVWLCGWEYLSCIQSPRRMLPRTNPFPMFSLLAVRQSTWESGTKRAQTQGEMCHLNPFELWKWNLMIIIYNYGAKRSIARTFCVRTLTVNSFTVPQSQSRNRLLWCKWCESNFWHQEVVDIFIWCKSSALSPIFLAISG